ncbi:MAG: exo-alpha-sialidase [Acidobacteria bacterium]|nr:exo-alpha-sialidase [Acidobacteriota bacterium]
MTRRDFFATAAVLGVPVHAAEAGQPDWRNVKNGWQIPREGYSDQPYVVVTRDGNWLCVLTTGRGVEGEPGQHIISTISTDQGRTWSTPIDIEPADGPEASWVMPFIAPGGRVYVFYTYNSENLRLDTRSNNPKVGRRVDTLGKYAYKYSDDHGHTWSKDRYFIPMRPMRIDRENAWEGKLMYFWGVGKPILTSKKEMIFGYAKVGKWGDPGGMVTSQGVFLKSSNIATEKDPAKLHWELLPEGDEGLRAPKNPVSDEANLVELSDGSLYCTYRSIDGYNCAAYSRNGGKTWTPPGYATYTPGGRPIKHPRAANFVRKFSNGKFLLWYHNHAGEAVHAQKWPYYTGRNPGWISGGVEKNGYIHWSQPEILLYDDNPDTRISYPDFVEDKGRYYITETVKTYARVHPIDQTLLDGVWNQLGNKTVAKAGLVAAVAGGTATVALPKLAELSSGGGFSLEFWVKLSELSEGQVLFDTVTPAGQGVSVRTSDRFTLALTLNDGRTRAQWDSDPGTHAGTMRTGVWQHVVFIVDGGPKILSVVIDGILNDGGAVRDYGWGRFAPELGDVNGEAQAKVGPKIFGEIRKLRVYSRALRTSEAVGNHRAGMDA